MVCKSQLRNNICAANNKKYRKQRKKHHQQAATRATITNYDNDRRKTNYRLTLSSFFQTKNAITDPDYNGCVDLGKELSAMQNALNEQIDKLDKVKYRCKALTNMRLYPSECQKQFCSLN